MPIIKKTNRYFNTSRRGAELIKYASNAFLATKISFINELANLCEKANVDIKDISLISTLAFSHKLANSLINEIFVAKKAFEAYLISSAPLLDVLKYLLVFLIIGK